MTVESLNDRSSTAWDFLEPVRRFPLPVLCALLLTALNWTRFDYFPGAPYSASGALSAAAYYLSPFLIAVFLLSFAFAFYGEAKSRKAVSLAAAAAGILLLAMMFSAGAGLRYLFLPLNTTISPEDVTSRLSSDTLSLAPVSRWFVLGGLALLPLFGPYAGWRAEPAAFWQFAHKLGAGFLAALAGAGLAFGGFAAIIETAKLLFGATFPPALYAKAADLAIYFSIPIILLTLAPSNFSELPKRGAAREFTSQAVALLVKYILIPVASVLSLMLAVYIALVLIEGRFETARFGFRGLVYGSGIILTALLSYPEREDSRLVRLFWRIWPWLLVAPSVLFFPALWVRIGEYGWTPFRYLAFIAGVWMALTAILAVRFRSNLRFIPGLLALLLILAAFGPWGASQVTGRSQAGRLEALFAERGLLASGRWQEGKPVPAWKWKEQQQIRTALFDLSISGELERLKPWFQGSANDPFAPPGITLTKLESRFGASYGSNPPPRETVSFSSPSPRAILKIPSGGYAIGPINQWALQNGAVASISTPLGPLEARTRGAVLEISLNKERQAKFSMKDFLAGVEQALKGQASSGPALKEDTARLLSGDGDPGIKLAVVTAGGNLEKDQDYHWSVYVVLAAEP
jgi:hypothetical protein